MPPSLARRGLPWPAVAVPTPPYSPAFSAGDLLFCSGQIGLADDALVEDFEAQIGQALDNLVSTLQRHGATLTQVVKTTVFLTDMGDFATMNDLYRQRFGEHLPARSTVAVVALPRGASFEIEAIAYVA